MTTQVMWPPVWCVFNDDEGAFGIDELDDGVDDIVVDDWVADDDDDVMSMCDLAVVVVVVVAFAVVSKQFGLIF